ncbi:MAG: hypothetical protein JNL24_06435 [Bacteroidia bacterium]|nr:hypothetical protein [Bacteroidia bacterium]
MKNTLNIYFFLLSLFSFSSCNGQGTIDSLEFQKGYPKIQHNALEQLRSFPSPRYKTNNDFMRLFNWISPHYMAGKGQKDVPLEKSLNDAVLLQEELCLNWNYMIVLPNPSSLKDETSINNPKIPYRRYIDFANAHPEIPLTLTTFWVQSNPKLFGIDQKGPNVSRQDHPESYYIADKNKTMKWKKISYVAPDSLFIKDGMIVRKNIEVILKELKRPIDIINENGEEPPNVFDRSILENDPELVKDKNALKIADWDDYIAIKKTKIRTLYSSQFMSHPQLKNTLFTAYAVEGGPVNRFDWHFSKTTCSKIKGNYYSTPDFYPRTPDNWKNWKGAWHGWKWINDGRKVEIKDGDKFFSPFVAAGWHFNPEKDMRPAQWLGLLKCLGTVGAEFYYAGYFNLKAPFSLPENYVWQAAMPAYAQAITTHYPDVFFSGNVLFDNNKEPIITYPNSEEDVLVTIRKHDTKEKYIIATTVQPSSNTERAPLEKDIVIAIANEKIKLTSRRQGSVYVYDKSVSPAIVYQLDKWHQYEHPSRWRKDWICEAEVCDSSSSPSNQFIHSEFKKQDQITDLTKFVSYVELSSSDYVIYNLSERDVEQTNGKTFLHLLVKNKDKAQLTITGVTENSVITIAPHDSWTWIKQEITVQKGVKNLKIESKNGAILLDKIILSDNNDAHSVEKDY